NAAAPVTQVLTVTNPAKTNHTVTLSPLAPKVVGDASFTVTATASSGLAVTFTSSNPAVATVTAAGVVTILSAGTTNIVANQAGNATFNAAAPVTQVLTVTNPSSISSMEVMAGSTVLANNGTMMSIGSNLKNVSTSPYTFTIKNMGSTTLTIFSVSSTTGFTITSISSNSIEPNGSATFKVSGIPTDAFAPTNGAVSVASSDVNSPFTINVSVQVGTPTSITKTLASNAIDLYPNPTSIGYSNLEFNGSFDDVIVTIYSADGSKTLVESFSTVSDTNRQLNVQELPSGVYFVEVNTTQGKLMKRLIKQ
ncbi:T9SS type A sorting domain-containing protein, partial [uncultured Cytophaga sp.]|uniref:T9SS type A sorting domain-containing protein n=1 Tax=uncultured Cytophaga sp. TaxID=160238 RepID=UPI002610E029